MTVTKRETSETSIRVELKLGGGVTRAETGNGFLDHMLSAFARYSGLALDVKASSDLKHHLVEDVALTLGRAFREIIPVGAARYDPGAAWLRVDPGVLPSACLQHLWRPASLGAGGYRLQDGGGFLQRP